MSAALRLASPNESDSASDGASAVRPASSSGSRRPQDATYLLACRDDRWSLYLTRKGRRFAVPYRCHSWRCKARHSECARKNAQQTFARLKRPLEVVNPAHVLMLVLTFDQREMEAGAAMVALACGLRAAADLPPADAEQLDPRWVAYRTLWRRWQSLRQALNREAERRGHRRSRWAMTTEAHRSGWPHVHVLMEWPWLAAALAADDAEHDCTRKEPVDGGDRALWRARLARRCGHPGCLRDWLSQRAEACGFGRVSYCEGAKDREQAAGYILKLAGEMEKGSTAGEVLKLSQLPVNAPRHFRRLRYSLRSRDGAIPAMLDPVHVEPGTMGALCNQPETELAAAIAAGLDVINVVDDDGEVHLVPTLFARPPPGPAARVGPTAPVLHPPAPLAWHVFLHSTHT